MESSQRAAVQFEFRDRVGNKEVLTAEVDQTITDALRAHGIPPSSVVVLRDGTPVSCLLALEAGPEYVAALIEGYDIGDSFSEFTCRDKRVCSRSHYFNGRVGR